MSWSTRELAELAGTTVNTIRHYHRLGLLAQPARGGNGYKRYEVLDLVRLLRVRRLTDLGVPLAQIGDIGAGAATTPDALAEIDAQLAASIQRLQRARDDIALILRDSAPADGPAGFESVASKLSEADSSILHIYSKMYDDQAMADLQEMVAGDQEAESGGELDTLPADADEETRERLARVLAPGLAQNLRDYPWLSEPAAHSSKSERETRETFIDAVRALYNPAQLDVLVRASALAHEMNAANSE